MGKTTNGFSPEVRKRAVRMVLDHERDHRHSAADYSIPAQFDPTAAR